MLDFPSKGIAVDLLFAGGRIQMTQSHRTKFMNIHTRVKMNKAGYTATEVACGWAGAIFEVTRPFEQEQ